MRAKMARSAALVFLFMLMFASGVSAHDAGTAAPADTPAVTGEAEGRILWEELRVKAKTCADLSRSDYDALGEYFMGLMTTSSHEAMDQMITGMLGNEGEEEMHVVMGSRLSDCNPAAVFSGSAYDVMTMMLTMFPLGPNFDGHGGHWDSMMGYGYGPGAIGWLGTLGLLTWLVWLAVGVLLAVWLWQKVTKK